MAFLSECFLGKARLVGKNPSPLQTEVDNWLNSSASVVYLGSPWLQPSTPLIATKHQTNLPNHLWDASFDICYCRSTHLLYYNSSPASVAAASETFGSKWPAPSASNRVSMKSSIFMPWILEADVGGGRIARYLHVCQSKKSLCKICIWTRKRLMMSPRLGKTKHSLAFSSFLLKLFQRSFWPLQLHHVQQSRAWTSWQANAEGGKTWLFKQSRKTSAKAAKGRNYTRIAIWYRTANLMLSWESQAVSYPCDAWFCISVVVTSVHFLHVEPRLLVSICWRPSSTSRHSYYIFFDLSASI